jgi:ABC-type amino acid transport substrate-binding protein
MLWCGWRAVLFLNSWIYYLVVFWVSVLSQSAQATVIKIAIHQQDLEGYHQLINHQSCGDVSEYSSFKGQLSNLYFILICQALLRSQFDATFQAVAAPNYRRSIWQVAQGLADISASTYMENQYISPMLEAGSVSFSVPIIKRGEQVAAYYALPSNAKAMAVTNLEELKKLRVVIPSSWRHYADIFRDQLGMEVEQVKSEHLFEFLVSGRADFTALRLQGDRSEGYAINRHGITLKPITGIKALLNYASYFIVGRNQPHSDAFFQALQKGLRQMREDGTLVKALRQSRVLSDNPEGWKTIYEVAPREDIN